MLTLREIFLGPHSAPKQLRVNKKHKESSKRNGFMEFVNLVAFLMPSYQDFSWVRSKRRKRARAVLLVVHFK